MLKLLAAGLLAGGVQACSAGPGAVTVRELGAATRSASRQPIRLPQGDARVVLSDYVIPAGATLPVHKHPHPRLAFVQSGRLEVTNVDTGDVDHYGPGDLIVEAVDQWHFGVNAGSSPVHLLVLDLLPGGVGSNTVQRN